MSALPQVAFVTREGAGERLSGAARLVPPNVIDTAVPRGRLAYGFGPRFFLLLMLGVAWLAPAWWEPRFFYAMLAWDLFVFMIWFWDLLRVPNAQQITVSRVWTAPAAFETESHVTVIVRNSGVRPVY